MSVADRRLAPWAFAAIVVIAAALRLPALDARPMHTDEAVHAAKFGRLLEQGLYEYDPTEFHGPTLNYLTLIPARAQGIARYADLDEMTLRSVPAVIGILLVAAHVLLVPIVGFRPAALAALLAAVSPAMVYYSRYYIQETLLVAFSFGALISICRYLQTRRAYWAIAAGTAVGLMFATKETWVIAFASMAGALVLARALQAGRRQPRSCRRPAGDGRPTLPQPVLAALVVAGLLFSSFFSHPRGIVDAVATYTTWVARAGGATWHVHPWHYYFGLLLYAGSDGSPVWTEAAILGLALVGLVAAFMGSRAPGGQGPLVAFLGAYAVLMAVAYAWIPYQDAMVRARIPPRASILLAGVGGARLIEASPALAGQGRSSPRVLGAAVAHLGWLAWAGSVRFASDPRNPWVYAHTGTGVFEIARRVDALSRAHPLRR